MAKATAMACGRCLLLLSWLLATVPVRGEGFSRIAASSDFHKRMKREWFWNKMHISEELNTTLPYRIGPITSTVKNANAKYIIQGEGANVIFKVDDRTGDVYAYERLDREQKAVYHLKAFILDRFLGEQLEEPSPFHIVVDDINDNAPVFAQKVFNGSVSEMSPVGTSVTTVTATDADDPKVPGHAEVAYKIIRGENYFSMDKNGIIYTAAADLDREQQATYNIVIQAVDGMGLQAAVSGTATVHISILDINDNFPTFQKESFQFDVPENIPVGGEVGRLKVEDLDEPANRNTKYSFVGGSYQDTFEIIAKPLTNEGIIKSKKQLDFEVVRKYQFNVEATDADIKYSYARTKGSKSITRVTVNVKDVDEPPVFLSPSYKFEVQEESETKKAIGSVSAIDPDQAKQEIRYRILRSNYFKISNKGDIFAIRPLDREESPWHNLTVAANEPEQSKTVPRLETHAQVYIKVLDINDNAPELDIPSEPQVCENAAVGEVIITISAVDKDEMLPGQKFTYSLVSEDSNFTLIDNHDNTANITVKHGQFNRELVKIHYLPIIISDNGKPQQSSTNTLSIQVCQCDKAGKFTFCDKPAQQVGVTMPTLVTIFICILIIIVIILLIGLWKRQKKNLNFPSKHVAEIHEQLVSYDEEGGGEMDTTSYDVSILNSARQRSMRSPPRMTLESKPCVYSQVQKPTRDGLSGTGEMAIMIEMKKDEADNDGDLLPYDTLHIYGYEGAESSAESLSSLTSGSSDSDMDYDFLNDWGPRFKMLAEIYGLEPNEDLLY